MGEPTVWRTQEWGTAGSGGLGGAGACQQGGARGVAGHPSSRFSRSRIMAYRTRSRLVVQGLCGPRWASGHTPYKRWKGKNITHETVEFGEKAHFKLNKKKQARDEKLVMKWGRVLGGGNSGERARRPSGIAKAYDVRPPCAAWELIVAEIEGWEPSVDPPSGSLTKEER